MENIYSVLITAVTVLGGTGAFRYYEKRAQKKEKDDGSIIDVEDLTDLIPKGKKGFFKKTAQRGRIAAKKAAEVAKKKVDEKIQKIVDDAEAKCLKSLEEAKVRADAKAAESKK